MDLNHVIALCGSLGAVLATMWALGGACFLTLCWLLAIARQPRISMHYHVVPDDPEDSVLIQ